MNGTHNIRKNYLFLSALLLVAGSIGLTACGGGGSSGGGDSATDSDTGGAGSLSNSELVGFAYKASKLGSQAGGEESFQAPAGDGNLRATASPAQVVPSSTTTVPCTHGDLQITEQGDETVYDYNDCVNPSPSLNQRMNGQTVITSVGAADGFAETNRIALNDLVMRFSVDDDFIEQRVNGNHETSSNPGVNILTESDIRNDMTYQCGDAQGSLTSQYTMTSQMDYTSEGMKYDTDLAMSISDYGAFDGDYTVSTLEPVYYQSGSANPYMGKQEFNLPNGQILVVRYDASGLYIDDEFHSWNDLINEAPFVFPSTSSCFDAGTGTGNNPDSTPGSTGFTATINGSEYSDPNAVVSYFSSNERLALGSFVIVSGQSRSISFHATEVNGTGTYIIPFLQYHEGDVTGNPGDTELNTWIMENFNGEGDGATINVVAFGPDLIEGTFSGTLYPAEDNPADQQHVIEITNGTFSLVPHTFE